MLSSSNEERLSSLSNSVKYFDQLTQFSNSHSLNSTLKSFYLHKHALSESKVATKPVKYPMKCRHCNFNFADKLSQHYVKPSVRNRRFYDKILKKHERGDILTTYQRLHLKKMDKSANNKMIIVCAFCNYNTSVLLQKPKDFKPGKADPKEEKESLTSSKNNAENSKKRKKRRKDKFCGLNSSHVLSAIAETADEPVALSKQENTAVKENNIRQDEERKNESLSTNINKNLKKSNNTIHNINRMKRKNSQQLTRNMNESKMKIAKSKKTLKMKISSMLNMKSESAGALSLQNLIKEM